MRTTRTLLLAFSMLSLTTTALAQTNDPFRVGLWGIFCDSSPNTNSQTSWQKEADNFSSLNANYLEACIRDTEITQLFQSIPSTTQVTIEDNPDTGEPYYEQRLLRWIRHSESVLQNGTLDSSWTNKADEIIDNILNTYGGNSRMGYYLTAHENGDLQVNDDTMTWPGLRYVINRIHEQDPDHRSLVVSFQGSVTDTGTQNFLCGSSNCIISLAEFAQLFPKLGVYHLDAYLFHDTHSSTYSDQQDRLNYYVSTYNNAMNAFQNGYTRWRAVIQTQDGYGSNATHIRRPTLEEIRVQAYLALSRGSNGVLAYLYSNSPLAETGLVDSIDHDPITQPFSNVASVFAEVRQLESTLQQTHVTDAFPRTNIPSSNSAGVRSVGGNDIEIGVFEDNEGRDYFMLVNRRLNDNSGNLFAPQSVSVAIAGNVALQNRRNSQYISGTYNATANETAFTVTLDPGRGELFQVILPPAAPSNLALTNAGSLGQHPQLSWSASPDVVASYAIERRQVGVPTTSFQEIDRTTSTSYTDDDVIIMRLSEADYTYYYQVKAVHASVSSLTSTPTNSVFSYGDEGFKVVSADLELLSSAPKDIPRGFEMSPNYPNPFNPETSIRFGLPVGAAVSLVVYDAMGRLVDQLVSEYLDAGYHEVKWSAENLPSGIYFYRLRAGDFTSVRQMLLLK